MKYAAILLMFVIIGCSTEKTKEVADVPDKVIKCSGAEEFLTIDMDSSFHLESEDGDSIFYGTLYVRGTDKVGIVTYCSACDSVEQKITDQLSFYRMFYQGPKIDKGKYFIDTLTISNYKALLISTKPKLENNFFELLFENVGDCVYYVRISGLGISAESDSLLRKSISSIKLKH